MKIYRRSVWALSIGLLPLLALKCDKEDIVKANQFEVKVRVTGEQLDGLGAEMQANSRLNVLNPKAGPALAHAYTAAANQTYALGTFGLQDDVTIAVAFKNVSCSSALQPAGKSKLKVELLANGAVVNSIELKPGSRGGSFTCNPYWGITTVSESGDWD